MKGLSLAMPRRIQAAAGRLRKKERVAWRAVRNSSTCRAQENSFAAAAPAATFSSKLGSGSSKPRANQRAGRGYSAGPSSRPTGGPQSTSSGS